MTGVRFLKTRLLWGGSLVVAAALSAVSLAQTPRPNERDVVPAQNVLDRDELFDKAGKFRADSKVWVLHFRFKDPRLITVDVPGRGRKVCWYLWYQVINRTSEPRICAPEFELVTLDKPNAPFRDQILPKVQEAIQQVEDPSNSLRIRNSVTLSSEPIPVTRPDGPVRAITGVAIWDDVDPESNRYSIFVSGLSDGMVETDPPPGEKDPVVRRKTLQLDFKRVGDRFYQDSREIQFMGPAQWVYRATRLKSAAPRDGEKKETKPAPKTDGGTGTLPSLPRSSASLREKNGS